MSESRLFYGLVIPGIGHPDWGDTGPGADWALDKPLCICNADPEGIPGIDDYICLPLLSAEDPPDHLGTSINYRAGTISTGSLNLMFASPGPYRPVVPGVDVSESYDIGKFLARRRTEAAGLLSADVTAGATSIELWSRSGVGFSAGDIIYIEKEAIYLETQTSSSVPNKTQTFDCVRGCFGTTGVEHLTDNASPAPPGVFSGYDNRVWTDPQPRKSSCYAIKLKDGTLQTLWRGYLVRQPSTGVHGAGVEIEPQDLVSVLTPRSQNIENYGTVEGGISLMQSMPGRYYTSFAPGSPNSKSNEWGAIRSQRRPTPAFTTKMAVLQIGETLLPGHWDTQDNQYEINDQVTTVSGIIAAREMSGSPLLDTEVTDENPLGKPQEAIEVLAVGQGVRAVTTASATVNITYTGTTNPPAEKVNHPLYALLCYMLSTGRYQNQSSKYDIWNVGVGLGLPIDVVDVAGIEALIDARPQEAIYQSYPGYGGRDYDLDWIINNWLLPFRYYLRENEEKKISVGRLEVVLADEATQISSEDITIFTDHQEMGWDDVVETLRATANQPWEPLRDIVIRDRSQGIIEYDPRPLEPQLQMNVSCLKPSSALVPGRQRNAVDALLQFYRRPIPTYRFRITDDSETFYAGMKLELQISDDKSIFYDSAGDTLGPGDTLLGIVTEVRESFESPDVEIELSGVNDSLVAAPKRIGPSFTVTAFSAGVVRVSFDEFGPEDQEYWAEQFRDVYTYCEFWDPATGKLSMHASGDPSAITGVTLAGSLVELTFGEAFTLNPAEGNIIRLVTRDQVAFGGETRNTAFAYVADENEVFSDGDPGDIYV